MASSHCFENPPELDPAGGGGLVVQNFGGVKAYIAGSAESKAAVVLVSDAFGFEAPKLRMIASKVASSGYFVVVPDFLRGDPYDYDKYPDPLQWLKSHNPEEAFEEAKPVIAALREKGVSTLGAAGYCWGGKLVVEFAKALEIQAAVLLHPGFVTVDDIQGQRSNALCVLGAEIDQFTPQELVKQFEEVLSAKDGVAHFLKIFLGVTHGWAVRYDDDDAASVKSAEEALADMMDWFDQYLW